MTLQQVGTIQKGNGMGVGGEKQEVGRRDQTVHVGPAGRPLQECRRGTGEEGLE